MGLLLYPLCTLHRVTAELNFAADNKCRHWCASIASGANNGGLTLWIDGVQRINLTRIDNDTRRIDHVRLGAIAGIDSGTCGMYYLDAFESHRQTYIGP